MSRAAPKAPLASWLFALVFATLPLAAAQSLIVNGNPLPGGIALTIANTGYTAAQPFAEAIGASYSFDEARGLALFQLSGRLASLRVYSSEAEAAGDTRALGVEGREVSGLGGLLRDGVVYAQVRSLAAAFGGVTAPVEAGTVAVFFERAVLREVSQPEAPGDDERIVLTFSRDTPIERHDDFNTVRLRFLRASLGMSAQWLRGSLFNDGALYAGPNYVELRLTPHEGVDFDLLELPQGQGVQVVIDLFREVRAPAEEALKVVLDPAPASPSQDDGLVLSLARRVERALARRGRQVELTRDIGPVTPLESRANRGIGAHLFVSLQVAPLAEGQVNLFYLADATGMDSLKLAIRLNAETETSATTESTGNTDELRRRLLLDLLPDLAFGARAASTLAAALGEAGYEPAEVAGMPLYVLGGAAGRGVLVELSPLDLRDPKKQGELADTLSASLDALLSR